MDYVDVLAVHASVNPTKPALIEGERVVDFGCGTGRDTVRLLPMLPDGRVIAIDGSQRMLSALRARLGSDADRVQVLKADLSRSLPLDDPVDAVVSVATLHWLPDHSAVFRHIADALRPGGQLVAEFGGYGNIATVTAALADVLGSEMPADVWNFPGPDETRRRLEAAVRAIPAQRCAGRPYEIDVKTSARGPREVGGHATPATGVGLRAIEG